MPAWPAQEQQKYDTQGGAGIADQTREQSVVRDTKPRPVGDVMDCLPDVHVKHNGNIATP